MSERTFYDTMNTKRSFSVTPCQVWTDEGESVISNSVDHGVPDS